MADSEGKPSYLTSTTSMIVLVAAIAYTLGCIWIILRGQANDGITGLWRLFETVFGAYAIRAGYTIGKNGRNGQPPQPQAQPV